MRIYYPKEWSRQVFFKFKKEYARVCNTLMRYLYIEDEDVIKLIAGGYHRFWYLFKRTVKDLQKRSLAGVVLKGEIESVVKNRLINNLKSMEPEVEQQLFGEFR